MAEEGPGTVGDDDPEVGPDDHAPPGSFFADRMAETHGPWLCGKVEVPPPDDVAVAELDESDGPLDDLEILCPGETFDQVCDVLDTDKIPPGDAAAEALRHFHLDRPPEAGWLELTERLNLYGPGIEFDLWDRGYALTDYFLGAVPGGWDHLFRMITRLPMGSHYRAGLADDDGLAEQILARYGPEHTRPKSGGRPPLAEFDRHAAYLHAISNKLGYIGWAVFAAQAGKKKGSPPKGDKGPETAAERAEFRDHMREHEEIVGQVLKRKGGSRPKSSGPAPEAVRGAVLLNPPAIGDGPGDDDSETTRG